MKAIRANEWCQPEGLALEEIDSPTPARGEVRVRVNTAALNFPDVLMIQGQYQVKPPLPFTPGFEFCGTVDELGPDVAGLQPGTRVMGQCELGAFAEQVVAPAFSVHPAPDGLSDEQAAAFPLVYQTSYFALAYRGQLAQGETVLVHSAAGGVGLAAVQIARALGAGRVIGTVGSDHKRDLVLENGADAVFNYESEDFATEVKQLTEGRGADVIFDPVGGDVGERSTKCIAFEGRLVVIGFTSGKIPTYRANHVLIKNYSVVGLHWGFYRLMNPEKIKQGWNELMDLFRQGGLKPHVGATFDMPRVAEAMHLLLSRQSSGKIVLHW